MTAVRTASSQRIRNNLASRSANNLNGNGNFNLDNYGEFESSASQRNQNYFYNGGHNEDDSLNETLVESIMEGDFSTGRLTPARTELSILTMRNSAFNRVMLIIKQSLL